MKNNKLIFIVAVNLLVLVLLAIFVPHLMISPGKPIDAHTELTTDCFACHTAFFGSSPEKCIACHKIAEIGLKTVEGLPIAKEKKNVAFHQTLIEEDCIACHSDHKGVQAFRPISQFSHQLLDLTLQKQCDNCHVDPDDALHREINGNCKQCHDLDDWLPATFAHEKYFRFDRDHTTECKICHIKNNYADYTCYGCHEHSRSKIREEHVEEGIYDYEICVDCHRSDNEDEAERIWNRKQFEAKKLGPFEMNQYNQRKGKYYDNDDD